MATYCISDIHGNIDAFKLMLRKINFRFDGSDSLIVMGDMIDGTENNMKTLLLCKELSDKYDFVTVLMGNHELMMLDTLKKLGTDLDRLSYDFYKTLWSINNGEFTLSEYIELSTYNKINIKIWLDSLKYFKNVEIAGKKFYVTHSYPMINSLGKEYKNVYEQMVWERVELTDNPIRNQFRDSEKILIYGHTPTKYYNSFDKDRKCKILLDLEHQKIGIDCCAKSFNYKYSSRLACIRLDDLEEFYISKEDVNKFKT